MFLSSLTCVSHSVSYLFLAGVQKCIWTNLIFSTSSRTHILVEPKAEMGSDGQVGTPECPLHWKCQYIKIFKLFVNSSPKPHCLKIIEKVSFYDLIYPTSPNLPNFNIPNLKIDFWSENFGTFSNTVISTVFTVLSVTSWVFLFVNYTLEVPKLNRDDELAKHSSWQIIVGSTFLPLSIITLSDKELNNRVGIR